MATYNGDRFLSEQLESLVQQTHPPDELIVCDDCSSDRTIDIVEQFARRAPFPVSVVRNDSHQGYVKTFVSAAGRCRGDLVAFCDQDDIWHPAKLERCVAEFGSSASVTLVVHSAHTIDDAGDRLALDYPAHGRRRRIAPASRPVIPDAPGFATVASRRLINTWDLASSPLIPSGDEVFWTHDSWIAFAAAAVGYTVILPDRLALYRQHGANAYGVPPSGFSARANASLARRGDESQMYTAAAYEARRRVILLREIHRQGLGVLRSAQAGPGTPEALWARIADANDRRSALYSLPRTRRSSAGMVLANLARGDYKRRVRGGFGASGFGRDALHAVGLLDRATCLIGPRS